MALDWELVQGFPRLPDQPQCKLQLPVVGRSGSDRAEVTTQRPVGLGAYRGVINVAVGRREDGMVQDIEAVKLELELQFLTQADDLKRAEVKRDITRSAQGISTGVAKYFLVAGHAEGIQIEPILDGVWSRCADPRHYGAQVFFKVSTGVHRWTAGH